MPESQTSDVVEGHKNEPASASTGGVSEEAMRFGPQDQLVGVMSRPVNPRAGAPAVVILNAGLLHRVGPHRLHVVLGRTLATKGLPTLRLDLGGVGDSVTSSDAITFRESAVADTRAAMDGVGASRYVILGLCAGADNALATALVDERVVGIVLVDPPGYATLASKLRAFRNKLGEPGGAPVLARRAVVRLGRMARAAAAALRRREAPGPSPEGRVAPPASVFGGQLAEITGRGVKVLAVYSGNMGPLYNHPDQIFEVFPELRGRVDRAYFPDANHTFTELSAQSALVVAVGSWLEAAFR